MNTQEKIIDKVPHYNLYLVHNTYKNRIEKQFTTYPKLIYQCTGDINTLKQNIKTSLFDKNKYGTYLAINPDDKHDTITIIFAKRHNKKWNTNLPTVEIYYNNNTEIETCS